MTRVATRESFDPQNVKGSDAFLGREFPMSAANFKTISSIAYESSGIVLTDSKQEMVYSRLARRLRKLGLKNFNDYLEAVEQDRGGESTGFMNAITTNLTSFFRENHHFEYLKNTVIPDLASKHRKDRRIRVWCTAASTGEEPYSIAMVFKESVLRSQGWDVKILCTDIDSNVLDTAQKGVYSKSSIEDIDAIRKRKWFQPAGPDQVVVDSSLKELITFKKLNLLDKWPMKGMFDVVFCRNVIIYFDKETQKKLFKRVHALMADDSYLLIGHSESLIKVSDKFEPQGGTIYKRI